MDLDLKGKTALVTGSTLGIGYAIAQRLAREGADVIVNGRTRERVEEAVARIKTEVTSAKARGIAADLGTAEGCEEIVRQLRRVDLLVNNVGIFEPKPFEKITDADWQKFFTVNVMSGVRLSRSYLPAMKESNWGVSSLFQANRRCRLPQR
jgi:NAD(P)-dependent dehydrogenase (short-subunit alcohol dehydrogenase family)